MEKQVLDFNVLIEQDEEGVYVATVPEIDGCYTQGKSLNEVLERIKEAIEVCLEADKENFVPMKFIGIQRVQVKNPICI
jgi:predicted RNase H-like HicB family nuclease